MQNLRQLQKYIKGMADLGEKRRFSRREAYEGTSSLENDGRKSS